MIGPVYGDIFLEFSVTPYIYIYTPWRTPIMMKSFRVIIISGTLTVWLQP